MSLIGALACPPASRANQVTNPYFTGTSTAATGWTSSATGAGATFNAPLTTPNAAITAAGGSTEFSSGCVGAQCLTFPFVVGTSSGAQQTVSTTIGKQYAITFWTFFSTAGDPTNEIDVYWGSTRIYAGAAVATAGWAQHTIYLGAASTSSNTVTVMIRDDPYYSAITGISIDQVAPVIGVTKTSSVISDPINSAVNPKAMPDALIEYCFVVSNSGTGPADNVTATDVIPSKLSYVTGTVTSGTTCADSTTSGGATVTGSTLSASVSSLQPSTSFAIKYRATIN